MNIWAEQYWWLGDTSLPPWESHSSGRGCSCWYRSQPQVTACAESHQWTVERNHSPPYSPSLAHCFTQVTLPLFWNSAGKIHSVTIVHLALWHYSFVLISSPTCSYICLMFPGNSLIFWTLIPFLLTAHNHEHSFYFWISCHFSGILGRRGVHTTVCLAMLNCKTLILHLASFHENGCQKWVSWIKEQEHFLRLSIHSLNCLLDWGVKQRERNQLGQRESWVTITVPPLARCVNWVREPLWTSVSSSVKWAW